MHDVAAAARVSVATVSRVLNGNEKVDPERQRRVLSAIEELGYRRDGVARNLRRGSTKVWGLVISDIENPFFTSLVRGVQDQADEEGYSIILLNSDEDLDKEGRCLALMVEERVAGAILSPVSETKSVMDLLISTGTPAVMVDRRIRGLAVDTVIVDNVLGAYDGTMHLLGAGHRRVACISGPAESTTGINRVTGYLRALEKTALAAEPELIRTTDFKRGGGYRATLDLFRQDPRPDAMIVMNNLMTEGALHALRELGLRVPRDVALVGFDDLSWATLVEPQLTTIAQPVRELGRAAAELLGRRCRGDSFGFPAEVMLAPSLQIRESSVSRRRFRGDSAADSRSPTTR